MEAFKGIMRAVIALVASFVALAFVFACLLVILPPVIGWVAFDADGARETLKIKGNCDAIEGTGDAVLRFVLRLLPDCKPEARP